MRTSHFQTQPLTLDYPSPFSLNAPFVTPIDDYSASRTKQYLLAQLDEATEREYEVFAQLQDKIGPAAFDRMLESYAGQAERETKAVRDLQSVGGEVSLSGWMRLIAANLRQMGIMMVQRRRIERDAA